MTKAELIAALTSVPDHAEVRVFVDEHLLNREHNDQLDIAFVNKNHVEGFGRITLIPFVILHLEEAEDC